MDCGSNYQPEWQCVLLLPKTNHRQDLNPWFWWEPWTVLLQFTTTPSLRLQRNLLMLRFIQLKQHRAGTKDSCVESHEKHWKFVSVYNKSYWLFFMTVSQNAVILCWRCSVFKIEIVFCNNKLCLCLNKVGVKYTLRPKVFFWTFWQTCLCEATTECRFWKLF